jgi:hypothetical protein
MAPKNWLALAAGALVCVAFSASSAAAKNLGRRPASFECTLVKVDDVFYSGRTNEWSRKDGDGEQGKFVISGFDRQSANASVSNLTPQPVPASVEHRERQLVFRYDQHIGEDILKIEIYLIGRQNSPVRPFVMTFAYDVLENVTFQQMYGTCVVTSWQLPGTSSAPPNDTPSSSTTPTAAPIAPTPAPTSAQDQQFCQSGFSMLANPLSDPTLKQAVLEGMRNRGCLN